MGPMGSPGSVTDTVCYIISATAFGNKEFPWSSELTKLFIPSKSHDI